MRAWDIAKLLLDNCTSPQDVEEVLMTLDSPRELQELRSLLSSFSNGTLSTPYADADTPPLPDPKRVSIPTTGQPSTEKSVKVLPKRPEAPMMDHLESLFRSDGMTNKQVAQWFSTNFNINVPIGRKSLRHYLTKLLDDVDWGLRNRIFEAAQRLQKDDSSTPSDIESYWDQLDKQFSSVE